MQEPITTYNPLNDYRLILDVPIPVKKRVEQIKTEFDNSYKGVVIAGGQAFIYLAEFAQYESGEQALTDLLHRIALGFMPFKLHLKNFQYLEAGEIYIKTEEEKPVTMLIEQVKTVTSLLPHARFNSLPRITIAKGLQPFQLLKSWKDYEKESFSATFIANQMLLLKRMEGFSSWQILQRMEFQNMAMEPVSSPPDFKL